jgi:hypothetical protein
MLSGSILDIEQQFQISHLEKNVPFILAINALPFGSYVSISKKEKLLDL